MSEPLERVVDPDKPWRFAPIANRDEIIEEICYRLELGEPLATMCRDDPRLPGTRTVYDWELQDEAVAVAIARSRKLGQHVIAARLRQVAAGELGYSSGDVARDKLIIDTDLKLLAKWNPRDWGDNMQLRHADADGGKLDTAPLVNELLTLLPGDNAQNITPKAAPMARLPSRELTLVESQVIKPARLPVHVRKTVESQVLYTQPAAAPPPRPRAAQPAYRPRGGKSGVDDLV